MNCEEYVIEELQNLKKENINLKVSNGCLNDLVGKKDEELTRLLNLIQIKIHEEGTEEERHAVYLNLWDNYDKDDFEFVMGLIKKYASFDTGVVQDVYLDGTSLSSKGE